MLLHPYPSRFRRAVLVVAVASCGALLFSGLPASPASAAQSPVACANVSIVNGSFENPIIPEGTFRQPEASTVPGWSTTATDNRIEIWRAPFGNVPVADGFQFAEINATQVASLFQDFATTPGETIRWQLQHRGRTGVDVMEVRLGAPDQSLTMQASLSTGQTWQTYSGLYTVPAGQTTTRLSFDSISSANGSPSFGNFVDAVSVTSGACVVTSKSVTPASGDAVRLGDTLQYSIVAANQGASDASLTSVIDALPVGVSLVPGTIEVTQGATTTPVTDAAGDDLGEFDTDSREVRVRVGDGASSTLGGTLAAGASVTVAFDVIVDSVTALPSVDNTASVAFTDTLTSVASTSTSNTTLTTITPDAPALSIVTSGTVDPASRQSAATPGDTITWSYVVVNSGDVPLSDVTVLDPEGGTITCVPTTLAVGENATCTGTAAYTVTPADLVSGSVANGATARATPPFGALPVDSLESVATITTAALAPSIEVTVSHDNLSAAEPASPIVAGNQLRAHFVVTNTGNSTLDTVGIIDPIFGDVTCAEVTLDPGESTTCVADELYVVTDADALAGTISRTISATGVAEMGVATASVSDEQLVNLVVTLDLPTLDLPEPDEAALASSGAEVDQPLALALALVGAGIIVLGLARLRAVRRGRRGSPAE